MATERRRFMGELAAWHAAVIVAHIPFTGESLDPAALNPYQVVPPHVADQIERIKAFVGRRRLAAIGNLGG